MKQSDKTGDKLIKHYKKYPELTIQDICKFIYQSAFGCEHMVSSFDTVMDYILKEKNSSLKNDNLIDALDGDYSRVHLACLNKGLSEETFAKLFIASSKKEENGSIELENKINVFKDLVKKKELPFSIEETDEKLLSWKEQGYPALHHSEHFRAIYNPSYRVVSNKYVAFLPLFIKIDELLKKGETVIAIDGGSASGKTTLSQILSEIYHCTVFHMDDYFLRPEQRTPARYNEPGGNVDRERFLEEVLLPLNKKQPVKYRKFNCSTLELGDYIRVVPEKLTIIEGAYSMHPELQKYYDLSVFLDISPKKQEQRILSRNPLMAARFFKQWIPLEKTYFSKMQIKERCDIVFDI